jgi:hypothetical protein
VLFGCSVVNVHFFYVLSLFMLKAQVAVTEELGYRKQKLCNEVSAPQQSEELFVLMLRMSIVPISAASHSHCCACSPSKTQGTLTRA